MGSSHPPMRTESHGRRWIVLLVAYGLGASPLPVEAQSAGDSIPTLIVRSGRLAFDARASLGDFTGVTTTVRGATVAAASLAKVSGWVEAPVKSMETGNGRRDRDLNKSMESDEFPVIRYELDSLSRRSGAGDSLGVDLFGRLRIHGVTRPMVLTSTLVRQSEGYRLLSDFPVNVKDFKVGGLSKMLGLLKMNEVIVVHVDVVFARP